MNFSHKYIRIIDTKEWKIEEDIKKLERRVNSETKSISKNPDKLN